MKTLKMIVVALAVFAVVGCSSTPHKAGDCKTAVDGVCVLTYTDNENTVSSGDIDMRYAGLVKNGNEISGSVTSKAHQW